MQRARKQGLCCPNEWGPNGWHEFQLNENVWNVAPKWANPFNALIWCQYTSNNLYIDYLFNNYHHYYCTCTLWNTTLKNNMFLWWCFIFSRCSGGFSRWSQINIPLYLANFTKVSLYWISGFFWSSSFTCSDVSENIYWMMDYSKWLQHLIHYYQLIQYS